MKQIFQDLKNGETLIVESPAPTSKLGHCTIETSVSLISSGTERMLVNFGQGNLLEKALQQPEKVKQVLEKIKTDGAFATLDAVKSKLNQPLPLGYCNVGKISAVGMGVDGFKVGDRVVSNGAHASLVSVPKNLCALIPDNVSDEQAAFTVVASIALQGIRLAEPTLGERFVVIGAGLIGLCAIQLLTANGCQVLAIDFDDNKLALAKQFGALTCNPQSGEDIASFAQSFSEGKGVDAVIITASTKSSDPVSQGAHMCRKRGRIVLVGVTGLELNRADFYEKELSFQVSCSYGPGRYDSEYEEKGNDYPVGFVRWTEQRNFKAILDLLASAKLDFSPLISHRFAFDEAPAAYKVLTEDSNALGILLNYDDQQEATKFSSQIKLTTNIHFESTKPVIGFIGAGNYASRVLIPAFKNANAQLHTIVSAGGVNGVIHGEKTGFAHASTSVEEMLSKSEINTVVIATQHNTHAQFVCDALKQGKNVFVEKPLAINTQQLDDIKGTLNSLGSDAARLMVGFNRRFSPQLVKMKSLLSQSKAAKSFIFTVNAGEILEDHWTQDMEVGGGRIIGEACHFIDLMRFLADSDIVNISSTGVKRSGKNIIDQASITISFSNGSFGTIHYLSNGHVGFPKERIEVFCDGKIMQLDNFRKLKAWGYQGFSSLNLWKQDKGQNQCVLEFLEAIEKGNESPISQSEILEVAEATLKADELLRLG